MKKKKFNGLGLKKVTISSLNKDSIVGGTGGGHATRGVVCSRSCGSVCLCTPPPTQVTCPPPPGSFMDCPPTECPSGHTNQDQAAGGF